MTIFLSVPLFLSANFTGNAAVGSRFIGVISFLAMFLATLTV